LPEKITSPRGEGIFLYYRGMNVHTAVLQGITHDNTYEYSSIGKTMQLIEKYEVDMLGNVHKVEKEKRMDYSGRKNK